MTEPNEKLIPSVFEILTRVSPQIIRCCVQKAKKILAVHT